MFTSQHVWMTLPVLTIPESSCTAPVQSQNEEMNEESEAQAQSGIYIQLLDHILHESFNLICNDH